jgi:hypothetical protein
MKDSRRSADEGMIVFGSSFFLFRERLGLTGEMNGTLPVSGTSTGGNGVHGPGRDSLRKYSRTCI